MQTAEFIAHTITKGKNKAVTRNEFLQWWLSGCKGIQGFLADYSLINFDLESMFRRYLEEQMFGGEIKSKTFHLKEGGKFHKCNPNSNKYRITSSYEMKD